MRTPIKTVSLRHYEKFFKKFPVITFGNIVLRELMLSDVLRYYELLSDPEVAQFLSDEDIPDSEESARNEVKFWGSLFHMRHSIYWCIADAKSGNLIGTIGFNSWNFYNNRAEISYELMSQYWRRGIMSQVVSHVLEFAFIHMGVNRVEARTMISNIPSQRFLEKHGFTKEGTMKEYRKVRGVFIDILSYSLLQNDWQDQR